MGMNVGYVAAVVARIFKQKITNNTNYILLIVPVRKPLLA